MKSKSSSASSPAVLAVSGRTEIQGTIARTQKGDCEADDDAWRKPEEDVGLARLRVDFAIREIVDQIGEPGNADDGHRRGQDAGDGALERKTAQDDDEVGDRDQERGLEAPGPRQAEVSEESRRPADHGDRLSRANDRSRSSSRCAAKS